MTYSTEKVFQTSGLFTLSLRWVIGWTYFSAFWRRLIIDNKLIPEEAGYIGEKFNHFLPNALGIKPVIEYLVSNPEALHFSMVAFTIVEAIVGFFIIIGFLNRLMSVGVFFLAFGILLGSGWIGTTCLDEWQIGVLGIASGFTLFLSGGGYYSIDNYLLQKNRVLASKKWFNVLGSGDFMIPKRVILMVSLFIFGMTLYTNQYFHGGVFGKLHNKSVRPKVEISNIKYNEKTLTFELFRVEGADVYGSFLIRIEILNPKNEVVKRWGQKELSEFAEENIKNHYVAKIKAGKHSLILPLGAKADVSVDISDIELQPNYRLKLTDISGIEWEEKLK